MYNCTSTVSPPLHVHLISLCTYYPFCLQTISICGPIPSSLMCSNCHLCTILHMHLLPCLRPGQHHYPYLRTYRHRDRWGMSCPAARSQWDSSRRCWPQCGSHQSSSWSPEHDYKMWVSPDLILITGTWLQNVGLTRTHPDHRNMITKCNK